MGLLHPGPPQRVERPEVVVRGLSLCGATATAMLRFLWLPWGAGMPAAGLRRCRCQCPAAPVTRKASQCFKLQLSRRRLLLMQAALQAACLLLRCVRARRRQSFRTLRRCGRLRQREAVRPLTSRLRTPCCTARRCALALSLRLLRTLTPSCLKATRQWRPRQRSQHGWPCRAAPTTVNRRPSSRQSMRRSCLLLTGTWLWQATQRRPPPTLLLLLSGGLACPPFPLAPGAMRAARPLLLLR